LDDFLLDAIQMESADGFSRQLPHEFVLGILGKDHA
jgi:hypothetical protein